MEQGTYIDKVITSKDEINEIITKLKKYNFDTFRKTLHYKISIMEKDTNEEELRKVFLEFWRIEVVNIRKRKNNNENYDIYYSMDDGTYILYAINLNIDPPALLNAIHVHTNFNNFKKSLFRNYKDKLV